MQSGTIAVLLMCVATFLTALGIVLMKKAHNDKLSTKIIILRPPWIIGLCSKIISATLAVISFSMANQSTLSPTSALTMVYNILLAWKILGEPLDKCDIFAVILMCFGAILSEVYSTKTTQSLDFNNLDYLFSRKEAVMYIIGGYIFYITFYIISRQIISRGLLHKRHIGKIPLVTFGSFTGFQSGITGLCIKATVELIKTQYTGSHNFDYHPLALLFPISTMISVFLHLFFLNAGLKYYEALQMVPIVQSSMIIYNIMAGGIVLDEFQSFNDKAKICFPMGTVICCVGIFIIMCKNRKDITFEMKIKEIQNQKFESESEDSMRSEKIEQGENSNSSQQSKELVQLHQVVIEQYLAQANDSNGLNNEEQVGLKENVPNGA